MPPDARQTGYPDIARQLIEFDAGDGLEVVLGGGRARFLPAARPDPEYPDQKGLREDGRDLAAEWEKARPESKAVWNKAQFDVIDATRTRHLLGLFEPSHMQYEHDRPRDGAGEPSLAEMTAKALAMVSRNRRGYVLIVEGGRIDLAHHAGNAYRALTDTIAFSDAVRLAQMRTNPRDTLIVVTADHSHTLTIGGYPSRGNPILGKVVENDLRGERQPYPRVDLNGQPFTTLSYAQGPGYPGASEQQGEGPKRFPHTPTRSGGPPRGRPNLLFVDTTDPDYMQESALPLNTETHAGEDVAVYATGPGAQLFHGVIEQHVIFHVMARALRLGP
jgi:alkaline phosphatase